ncbi:MAG: putative nitroreductase family protein [Streblomastix strix]|uniref:Putative nitroreductase family protein n=1 Tax=Streblomastix strix TaxID=222440 RepID=A0A5J4VH13_9EUKA|nr:MAG: putative nitroreductase family protein [Streblomastix strix]
MSTSLENLFKARHSCRKFDANKPVEREKIEKILDAARLAPSARNGQPWFFHVVLNKEINHALGKELQDIHSKNDPSIIKRSKDSGLQESIFYDAPVVIYAFTTKNGMDSENFDLGLAFEAMSLEAENLKLGNVIEIMPRIISEEAVLKRLDVPKDQFFYANIAIGYRASDAPIPPKTRKELKEIAKFYE